MEQKLNVIKTLKEKLKKDRKTLTEFQTEHIEAVLEYLKGLKLDFESAKKQYEKTMKDRRER